MNTETMLTVLLRLATFIIMIQKLSCNLDLTGSYNSHTDHKFTTVANHANLLGFDSLTLSLPYHFMVNSSIKPRASVAMCEHP